MAFFLGYLVREPNSLRPIYIPVVGWLFVAWTLATTLWAINIEAGFVAWVSLLQLFAITLLIANLVAKDPGIIRKALWAYSITAIFTAAIAVVSSLQGSGLFSERITAFGGQNPAGFSSLVLPAAIFLMGEVQSRETRRVIRLFGLAALLACLVAILLSGTRSAWVGFVVASVVWLLLRREPRQTLAVAAIAFTVVILVSSVPGASRYLVERAGSSVATGGSGRADIWAVGLSIVESAPVVGVGFGNFPFAFTPDAIAQVPGANTYGAGRGPHNLLLANFAETGVVGGLLLLAFLGSALARANGDRIANIVRAALIALFVQSLFTDLLLQKHLWLLLGIAFGIAAAKRLDADSLPWVPKRARPGLSGAEMAHPVSTVAGMNTGPPA